MSEYFFFGSVKMETGYQMTLHVYRYTAVLFTKKEVIVSKMIHLDFTVSFKFGLGGQGETSIGTPASSVPAPAASPNPDVIKDTGKDTGKFSFSGFTFTTTPTLKPEKTEEVSPPKPQEEKKKESIFAGFSFGSSTANTTTSGFSFGTPSIGAKAGDTPGTVIIYLT